MNDSEAVATFSALSNPARLTLVRKLVAAGSTGMLAGELANLMDASPSKTSFHLAALTKAKLITASRESKNIRYQVNFASFSQLARYLLEDCCSESNDKES